MPNIETQRIIDVELQLKDAVLVAATAAAQVGGSDKVLDLGAAKISGEIMIDVTALEIASNDEGYDIVLQLSPDADFGTAGNIVDQADLHLGAKEVKRTDSDADDATGRYFMLFSNERNGTVYRYARLYTVVVGSIATGINYEAYMTKAAS